MPFKPKPKNQTSPAVTSDAIHNTKFGKALVQLLPEKAIFLPASKSLLISDLHLGKAETFQQAGIPIPQQVNQDNMQRLQDLSDRYQPKQIFILGDLFHGRAGLVDEVIQTWLTGIQTLSGTVQVIIGNHDRRLFDRVDSTQFTWIEHSIQVENFVLSHEPISPLDERAWNICGHIHPCVKLRSRLDTLRLPCFYADFQQQQLILPSFGTFTGGYELAVTKHTNAYVIADQCVIPLKYGNR